MATYAKYADMYKNRTRSQDTRVYSFTLFLIHNIYYRQSKTSLIIQLQFLQIEQDKVLCTLKDRPRTLKLKI
jgi:hypothetical protein